VILMKNQLSIISYSVHRLLHSTYHIPIYQLFV